MNIPRLAKPIWVKRGVALLVVAWLGILSPAVALAQEAGLQEPVGVQGPIGPQGETGTGPVGCVGSDCPVVEEASASTESEVSGTNSNTGEGSTNAVGTDVDSGSTTDISNTVQDTTDADLAGNTGSNTNTGNTGSVGTTTGDAGIGVTSVKNDNTAVVGGTAGLDVSGYNGDYTGDLSLGFGSSTADLGSGGSYQAINDTTGANSTNTVDLSTTVEEINEVQNDGKILNDLVLKAITGLNEVNANTGDATIATGDANVAATLVNLLNTTVINGSLMVSVADIFGDLMGNIVLPNLAALAAALWPAGIPSIEAGNENTGSDSTNTIDIDLKDTEKTAIDNNAKITTDVTAEAITGQNEAIANTGGGFIDTGDASVSLANLTVANTTVEGGHWALVIVSAFNRWLGFLVGDGGQVQALSQEETIEALNRNTGSGSTNTIEISDERERTTSVNNNAVITNEVVASAITGQNEASKNTGAGRITTGDANIKATAVNIANTTVKDGSLFVAVVNIFGDWFGDLLYGGTSLLASANNSQPVNVDAANQNTGNQSENTIDVNVERSKETDIDNNAKIKTNLNATIDTGTNKTNKNTLGGGVKTGDGTLALHSRALANLTGIALDPALGLSIRGLNDTTGFDSKNTIKAKLNDERIVEIDNLADVSTIFASLVNTGDNEANQNTIGGNILTGNIDANVGVHTLINRVILALAGGAGFAAGDHVIIDADFLNRLTGALSENSNEADVDYNFLADVMNKGLVDNLLKLLFNTGGNKANENTSGGGGFASTGGASITTGRVCFSGDVTNTVNKHTFDLGALWSIDADSDADVNNTAHISATTGNNEMNDNTSGGQAGETEECPKLAQAPSPIPPPPAGGGGQPAAPGAPPGKVEGGVGGGEVAAEEVKEGKVAVAVTPEKQRRINGGIKLQRFPVAGSVASAQWLAGQHALPWLAIVVGGAAVVGFAHQLDRRARLARLTAAA